MRVIRVGSASINTTPLDFKNNELLILDAINRAKDNKIQFLCLPELVISGYGCEDEFLNLGTLRHSEQILKNLIPHTAGMTVAIGLAVYHEGSLYNGAAIANDGKLVGINAKKFLPREGVHYEPRWFAPWPKGQVSEIEFAGFTVLLGDLTYKIGEIGLGVEICEEAWGPESGIEAHVGRCDLIFNPSASHFSIGKAKLREQLVADASRSLGACYIYSNLRGLEAGRVIYDGSSMIGLSGNIVARAERFGYETISLVSYDLDLDLVRVNKLKSRSMKSATGDVTAGRTVHLPRREDLKNTTAPIFSKQSILTVEEEFQEAAMVGLFDYLRKTKAKGFAISLSGGCDSSVCAYLCANMFKTAFDELGQARFSSLTGIEASSSEELIKKSLTCLYQASKFSTNTTETAAKSLALELNANYARFDVQSIISQYIALVETSLGRPLDWTHDDLALQNIQARSRGPGVWMLANIEQKILLSTSNRSEASVGYVTMDGDSAGGLAPIAGVDKVFLKNWIHWVLDKNRRGLGRVKSFELVAAQQPTAELRPSVQTDESDLMPYEVLGEIERLMVRDKMSTEEIIGILVVAFPSYTQNQLEVWTQKFRKLWRTNQWKRERLAPSFHLADYNVDPKSWCRFPIISGS